MAVFQGARVRGVIPKAEPQVRARSHARVATVIRPVPAGAQRAGARPMGILIAMILVATMVGLAYLTQTLGTNATTEEIDGLVSKANDARRVLNSQALVVEMTTDSQEIANLAGELRLRPLGDPTILAAP